MSDPRDMTPPVWSRSVLAVMRGVPRAQLPAPFADVVDCGGVDVGRGSGLDRDDPGELTAPGEFTALVLAAAAGVGDRVWRKHTE